MALRIQLLDVLIRESCAEGLEINAESVASLRIIL